GPERRGGRARARRLGARSCLSRRRLLRTAPRRSTGRGARGRGDLAGGRAVRLAAAALVPRDLLSAVQSFHVTSGMPARSRPSRGGRLNPCLDFGSSPAATSSPPLCALICVQPLPEVNTDM